MRERNGFVFDNPAGVIAAFEDMLSRSEEIVGRPHFRNLANGDCLRDDISRIQEYLDDLVESLHLGRPISGIAASSTTLWDGVQYDIQNALASEVSSKALGLSGTTSAETNETSYRETRRAYMSVGRRVGRLPSLQATYAAFWPADLDVAGYIANWRGGSDTIARLDRLSAGGFRYDGPREAIEQLTRYCSTVHRVLGPAIAHTMRKAFLGQHSHLKS